MTTKQLPEQGHEMLATGKDLQQSNEITAYTEVVEPRELETIRALKVILPGVSKACASLTLQPRQMAMIALGGSIGTGLVVGSGSALVKAGPGSLLVAYIMVGVV
jgi:amino acid permease